MFSTMENIEQIHICQNQSMQTETSSSGFVDVLISAN